MDKVGFTPPMWAAALNPNPEVITTLLKAGAEIETQDKDGLTALMYAVRYNPNPEVIMTLVKAGADTKKCKAERYRRLQETRRSVSVSEKGLMGGVTTRQALRAFVASPPRKRFGDFPSDRCLDGRMKFGGNKFLYKIRQDVDGYYFECEWDDMGVKIEKVIEQACKDCKIPRDDIHIEVQPIDPQVKRDARVRGMSEEQLRCVCAYLHLHGWKPKV